VLVRLQDLVQEKKGAYQAPLTLSAKYSSSLCNRNRTPECAKCASGSRRAEIASAPRHLRIHMHVQNAFLLNLPFFQWREDMLRRRLLLGFIFLDVDSAVVATPTTAVPEAHTTNGAHLAALQTISSPPQGHAGTPPLVTTSSSPPPLPTASLQSVLALLGQANNGPSMQPAFNPNL